MPAMGIAPRRVPDTRGGYGEPAGVPATGRAHPPPERTAPPARTAPAQVLASAVPFGRVAADGGGPITRSVDHV